MSAGGKGLARNYGVLSPAERFRLAVEAAARDDRDEYERLVDSCPTVVCRTNDPRFQDRDDTAKLLAMLAVPDAEKHLAKAALLQGVGERWSPPGVESPTAELERHAAVELARAAAVWHAFAAVCRNEMGLELRTVVAAYYGAGFVELHSADFDRLDAAKPDRVALADWRELYAREWRERNGLKR